MKNKIILLVSAILIIVVSILSTSYLVNRSIDSGYNKSYDAAKLVVNDVLANKLEDAYTQLSVTGKENQSNDDFVKSAQGAKLESGDSKYYLQYMGQTSNSIITFTITDKEGVTIGTIYTAVSAQKDGKWQVDDIRFF